MVVASYMFFKLWKHLPEIWLDHKLSASHKVCLALSCLTSTQSLHSLNYILKKTHYSRTPLMLKGNVWCSSRPVPFVLTYCVRTRIGAINSFVRYRSEVWSCVCLSSCGFSLYRLSLILSLSVPQLALPAKKPICVSCTCCLWLCASQQGGAVS